MRRATTVPSPDLGCSDKRNDYKSTTDYNRFLKGQIQRYVDGITGYTGDQIEVLKNSREVEQNTAYRNALENLMMAENLLNVNIQCINKDIIQRNDYSSRLYSLQQEIEDLRKELASKKQTANEAQERADQLEAPYNKTSWYETWFPLGRPMKKDNVPVLLSVSIVMLVFSLGIFLRYAGLELRLDSVTTSTNSFLKNINSRKYQ
jgi:outer membrane murein-binding lipoprotein Lpp